MVGNLLLVLCATALAVQAQDVNCSAVDVDKTVAYCKDGFYDLSSLHEHNIDDMCVTSFPPFELSLIPH